MPKSVHELAWDMGDGMRLTKRMKAQEAIDAGERLDENVKTFFDNKGAPVEMEGAEYEALVEKFGNHAYEIRQRLIAARLEGRSLRAEEAHDELMREAGDEAGLLIDGMNRISQEKVYGERETNDEWRKISGDPPIEFHGKKKRPKKKADVTLQYEIGHRDALRHLEMIDAASKEKKK